MIKKVLTGFFGNDMYSTTIKDGFHAMMLGKDNVWQGGQQTTFIWSPDEGIRLVWKHTADEEYQNIDCPFNKIAVVVFDKEEDGYVIIASEEMPPMKIWLDDVTPITYEVMLNGEIRGKIIAFSKEEVEEKARQLVQDGKPLTFRKCIVVPNKVVNIVAN